MKFIKRNYKYLIIFLFVLFLYVIFFYERCSFDTIWNYGFSHAIRIGEVPYRDFNLISTPLYSFIMSTLLFFKDDIFIFMIEQAILITLLFVVLFKLFKNKAYLFLPLLAIPNLFTASYNFLCFFLITLLFYLEKEKKNDYIIGFVLGLLIITKQTIGIPILFLSFLGIRNLKKILKRLSFSLIPCFILLLYLLFTNSFSQFINLCFLGLIDFGTKNYDANKMILIISLIILLILIFNTLKNNKNIWNYYALGSFFFVFPLFDFYHFLLFLGIVFLLLIDKIKFSEKFVKILSLILITELLILNTMFLQNKFNDLQFLKEDHFKLYLLKNYDKKRINNIIKEYKSYSKKYQNVYMLDDITMFYDLVSNKKITYFDVLLKGNYGYKGSEKMLLQVKNMHNAIFFIDKDKYKKLPEKNQLDKEIIKYIITKSEKIDYIENYNIYYKK